MSWKDFFRPFIPRVLINELYHRPRAIFSAYWAGFPADKIILIGVTGTDGKTSTVTFIHSILEQAGYRSGLISTVEARIGNKRYDTGLHTTTPDPWELQQFLRRMVREGVTHAVVEVTSHALAQYRVWGCAFDVAVITNVTREHLDYHGDYAAYLKTKARLLRLLDSKAKGVPKIVVLNRDDGSFAPLAEAAAHADIRVTYGVQHDADFVARDITVSESGTTFTAHTSQGAFPIRLSLIGSFFAANALAAMAATWHLGVKQEAMVQGLAALHSLPGRMEAIRMGQPFSVYIDFAHTPASLEVMLKTARQINAQGRVIVVFGCAGLRDTQKRPAMGRIAASLADIAVFTAEDPRTEDINAILAAIESGAKEVGAREGDKYQKIPDRRDAIAWALAAAQKGDIVVVTGKGHEQSMCIGTTEYPWGDRSVVREELAKLGYIK
jgi:UDP-N-acetylmuramoyl-L-alanyl-D-glutamate--2,6-diaminopimelate ligase